jgi:hypothetical protein
MESIPSITDKRIEAQKPPARPEITMVLDVFSLRATNSLIPKKPQNDLIRTPDEGVTVYPKSAIGGGRHQETTDGELS